MNVYRITLQKYSHSLIASGNPARWNSKDIKMIYTASSRALACLENVVHLSSLGLQTQFETMVIEIPDDLRITTISQQDLPTLWHLFEQYPSTQALGDDWIARSETPVLKVSSAIVAEESNYLLNPLHRDFKKIKLVKTEPFEFDARIKG